MEARAIAGVGLALVLAAAAGLAPRSESADAGRDAAQAKGSGAHEMLVARGRYLTHHVAMCVQCHTPRAADGTLVETELFRGAPVPARTTLDRVDWALQAPNIAGLIGFTDDEEIELLTRGHMQGRRPPKPPMPPFRLTQEDARSVVAYLRTLE